MKAGLFDVSELEKALEGAKVGVWKWSSADDTLVWSSRVFEIYDLAPEAFRGTLGDFLDQVHPDDREGVAGQIASAMEQQSQDFEVVHRSECRGELRWVAGKGSVLVDNGGQTIGMVGIVSDITEQRRTNEKLEENLERLRLYSELASDYIYAIDMLDPQLAPAIVAGSFERTTGYTPDDVVNLGGWLKIVHEEDLPRAQELLGVLQQGQPVVNEYRIHHKSGEVRWLKDRIRPVLNADGALIALNGGVQDITDRKTLEERLGHAQKMEALAHLAGSVAHDFNNLLTVMFGAQDLMEAGLDGEAGSSALEAMRQATERARDLTSSLLTFSRRQVAIRNAVSLKSLVEHSLPILQRAVGERIELRCSCVGDCAVAVDESQIELALLNLVVNAKDAMPEGGTIGLSCGISRFEADDPKRPVELEPGNYALISLRDEGTGITNDAMAHLFEPFFTTKEAGAGTGLGLAAVYGVVEQHQGVIRVATELGVGTTFSIYLPVSDGKHKRISQRLDVASVGGNEKILLVEDDPLVRSITSRTLQDLGYQVVEAASAEEALVCLEGADVGLILSDVRLPKMAGTELAERVVERLPDMRIVLMSGLVEDDEQMRVVESGRFPFLPKPFSQQALAKRLREALDTKPAR